MCLTTCFDQSIHVGNVGLSMIIACDYYLHINAVRRIMTLEVQSVIIMLHRNSNIGFRVLCAQNMKFYIRFILLFL